MKINRTELLQELHNHAEKFLMENFGMHFNIPIKINGRLRTTGGRFRYRYNVVTRLNTSIDIEIAKFVCENGTKEEILDILEHECIHYALSERGEPCGDNDTHFIDTCNLLNVCLNHQIIKQQHVYVCPDCGEIIEHYRKIPKGYCMICKHCDGKIRQENLASIKSMKIRKLD